MGTSDLLVSGGTLGVSVNPSLKPPAGASPPPKSRPLHAVADEVRCGEESGNVSGMVTTDVGGFIDTRAGVPLTIASLLPTKVVPGNPSVAAPDEVIGTKLSRLPSRRTIEDWPPAPFVAEGRVGLSIQDLR